MKPIVYVVFSSTAATLLLGHKHFAGFTVAGWAWAASLAVALIVLLPRLRSVRLPIRYWTPWLLVVIAHGAAPGAPLQRTIQLLCALVVGVAASSLQPHSLDTGRILPACKALTLVAWGGFALKSGALETGALPEWAAVPGDVMTAVLLSTVFATAYCCGDRRSLLWWGAASALPLVAVTRTASVAALLALPLTCAPMPRRTRAALFALIGIILAGALSLPRVQAKMFHSGSGSLSDIAGPDIKSNGRFAIWEHFVAAVPQRPLLGHGTGAGQALTRELTYGAIEYPHNDWLLTAFDYGCVGIFALACALIATWRHALRLARRDGGPARIALFASASAFVPYAILMLTDNIMVYASYFGNLHFLLLGLGYAAAAKSASQRVARAGPLPPAFSDKAAP